MDISVLISHKLFVSIGVFDSNKYQCFWFTNNKHKNVFTKILKTNLIIYHNVFKYKSKSDFMKM